MAKSIVRPENTGRTRKSTVGTAVVEAEPIMLLPYALPELENF